MLSFFSTLMLLLFLRQAILSVLSSRYSLTSARFVRSIGGVVLWGMLCVWWYWLKDTNLFLVTGGWWLCGLPFIGFAFVMHRWELRGAKLTKQNYKLFGSIRAPIGRSRKKLGTLRLYTLPEGSPLGDYSAQVTVSSKPEAYVGHKLLDYLSPAQFNAVIAHEMGHSLATDITLIQILRWCWRMFALPLALWFSVMLPPSATPWFEAGSVFRFLTLSVLAWAFCRWIAHLLGRRIELGADRFALKLASGAQNLIDTMEKMALKTRYNVFPNWFDRCGFVSHPSVVARMKAVMKTEDQSTGTYSRGMKSQV
jgi:Zn-dependent protease with chaperone function